MKTHEPNQNVLPCPTKPKTSRLDFISQFKGSLLILGIFIAGLIYISAINVPPVAKPVDGQSIPFIEWNQTISRDEDGTVFLGLFETSDGGILVAGFYNFPFFRKYNADGLEQWTTDIRNAEIEDPYPFDSNDIPFRMVEASNGDYIMSWGWSIFPTDFTHIVRTDQKGNILWVNVLNGLETTDILPTKDDGLLIIGGFNDWWSGTKPGIITKLDKDGNEEWNNTDLTTEEHLITIIAAPDGGYLVVGHLEGNRIAHKIDLNGNEEWKKTYESWFDEEVDLGVNIQKNAPIHSVEDGYLLHGLSGDAENGFSVKIVKISLSGDVEWTQEENLPNISGDPYNEINYIDYSIKTADDGLLLITQITKQTRPYYSFMNEFIFRTDILKFNKTGNIDWKYQLDTYLKFSSLITQVTPERYLISGTNYYLDIELLLFDINGTIVWNKILEKSQVEQFKGVITTTDRGVVLAGFINDDLGRHEPWWVGHDGIWLLKIDFGLESSLNSDSTQSLGFSVPFFLILPIILGSLISYRALKRKQRK